MPLESATYTSDLVTSNPAASDGMNNADDHMRLIKAAVKNTFPNISGAVTATHTQLNTMLSQMLGTTAYTAPLGSVAAPGYSFVGDTNTGIYSPGADQLDVTVGGVRAAHVAADKSVTFDGAISSPSVTATALTGPGVVPIGGMIMWLSPDLPTLGVWCWANGGTLSRTGNGAALFAEWSRNSGNPLRYGAGDGSTTFNVINMQEVVPVGISTMGGASSPGLLASISAGVKTLFGSLFGADTVTLTASQIPTITSNGVNTISVTSGANVPQNSNPRSIDDYDGGGAAGGFDLPPAMGQLTSTGNNNIGVTSNNTGGTAHNNVQPTRTVGFIIRIG